MKTGHDGREFDIRSSSEIEVVVAVAQCETARFLAEPEKQPRKVGSSSNGDDDVLAVSIKLKINIWSRNRILSQRQPRLVLQRHVEQLHWSRRSLDCAASCCGRIRLLPKSPTARQ